jgi:hypothetical protein
MMPITVDKRTMYEFFLDFDTSVSGDSVAASNDGGSGALTITDAAGGVATLATAAADNDYHVISSDAETFKVAANKPLWFEARVKLAEANTDDANIFVGLSDTVDGTLLTDNGGGPPSSWDGAGIFKVDGGTVWQAESSNATTQATTTSLAAFTTDTWTRLGVHVDPGDDTTADVHFFVDGVRKATHKLTISGMDEMHVALGVKAGAGNAETLSIDYVRAVQAR